MRGGLLCGVDGGMQFPCPLDRAEMILAGHARRRLPGVAILHVVVGIGVQLQQGEVDEVGGLLDLPRDHAGFVVFAA